MFQPEILKWQDIQSPKLTWNEYLHHIKSEEEKKKFKDGYSIFNVNPQKTRKLKICWKRKIKKYQY